MADSKAPARPKVMLIDDDEGIHVLMEHLFRGAGYDFCSAYGGEEGLQVLAQQRPDLLLLDVMMPGLDGYEVCRRIRAQGRHVPVVFLTAKGDIVDKRTGYGAGGDDYCVKPFNSEELLLRVDALIRRRKDTLSNRRLVSREGRATVGELEIDYGAYEVRKCGRRIDLTAKEFEIVALLAQNPGRVFTRSEIYAHIWGEGAGDAARVQSDENSITVFVHKIREKIEQDPAKPRYLLTVWRVGYRFAERV